jgi:hypothetical protein
LRHWAVAELGEGVSDYSQESANGPKSSLGKDYFPAILENVD